jgi:hypothetical protein
MANLTEQAARTYAAMINERDPDVRARLLEACWAVDGRLVTGGKPMEGRAAVAAMAARIAADPRRATAVLLGPIDVQGPLFRFRAVIEYADGTRSAESFDAGEVDADGRITTILTFVGPPPAE